MKLKKGHLVIVTPEGGYPPFVGEIIKADKTKSYVELRTLRTGGEGGTVAGTAAKKNVKRLTINNFSEISTLQVNL